MTNISSVTDYKGSLNDLNFNLGIFASGYESRSTFVFNKLNIENIQSILVFGFEPFKGSKQRQINDKYYTDSDLDINIIITEDDIYKIMNTVVINKHDETFKVLIDYSSMPRNWYNAIISWFKFQNVYNKVELFFVYSIGSYDIDYQPFIIDDIIPLPGLEGSDIFNEQSIALFGIGFDGDAAISVYDTIEPDIIHLFAADNEMTDNRAIILNKELIENNLNKIEKIPLSSVETAFRSIGEMISGYINNSHISIIPMGPKTLTLASILISHRFTQITCLRVVGSRKKAHENIKATGEIVISKVKYEYL